MRDVVSLGLSQLLAKQKKGKSVNSVNGADIPKDFFSVFPWKMLIRECEFCFSPLADSLFSCFSNSYAKTASDASFPSEALGGYFGFLRAQGSVYKLHNVIGTDTGL